MAASASAGLICALLRPEDQAALLQRVQSSQRQLMIQACNWHLSSELATSSNSATSN